MDIKKEKKNWNASSPRLTSIGKFVETYQYYRRIPFEPTVSLEIMVKICKDVNIKIVDAVLLIAEKVRNT